MGQLLPLKYILGQKGRYGDVGQVDHVTDLQIDRHTANNVGLFPGPAPFLKQPDHVDQRVAGGQSQVLHYLQCGGRFEGQ